MERKPRHPMTARQRNRMFALAKELGWNIDDLRRTAAQWTGEESLKSLSKARANQMNNQLQLMVDGKPIAPVANPQIELIKRMWPQAFASESDFRAWLKAYMGVDHEDFLRPPLPGKVIEALKAMIKRKMDG